MCARECRERVCVSKGDEESERVCTYLFACYGERERVKVGRGAWLLLRKTPKGGIGREN